MTLRESAKWATVPGFEGIYVVSTEGTVLRMTARNQNGVFERTHPRPLKWKYSLGYPSVRLTDSPRDKSFLVHKLVKNTFDGPTPAGMEIAHIDGVKTNPRLDNLKFATPVENYQDRTTHGTSQEGERNPIYRLTESQVRDIRRRLILGETITKVADSFGVGTSCIANIKHKRTHKYE